MRDDFNKQLTERERLGHKMKFGDYRNVKGNATFDEDATGGKESIHTRRRNAKGRSRNRKQFNENLNPLKNFLRVNVGRPWDKIYSEITSTFDKRKVINNHILEHLFDYVELNVYIIDGKPHTLNTYRGVTAEKQYDPIEQGSSRWPNYYVDPRDGLMKTPKQTDTRRQREARNAAKRDEERAKVYFRIDEDNHLILRDGIWFHYEAKLKPPKVMEYSYPNIYGTKARADWDALTLDEKKAKMIGRLVDAPMADRIPTPHVPGFNEYSWSHTGMLPQNKYFFRRYTASKKELKAAGIDGLVPDVDVKRMSHREASKYRTKKV